MPLIPLVLLTCLAVSAPIRQGVDLSGSWKFDGPKSMRVPGPDGRVVLAAMLGDQFVATQDSASLTLVITSAGQRFTARYKLDGTDSINVSPGEIRVTSRAAWDGRRLVIRSTSESTEQGVRVRVETRRVIWLDAAGDLIIERTGTPASAVTPSRSVYTKTR